MKRKSERIVRKKKSGESKSKLVQYDYTKLLDDIKLISRAIALLNKEYDPIKRKMSYQLCEDLMTRLYRDIGEMHEEGTDEDNREFTGSLVDALKEELFPKE